MGNGCIVPPFLTSAVDKGEWLVSRSGRGETIPGTHWIGGWMEPNALEFAGHTTYRKMVCILHVCFSGNNAFEF
jgi:hypothetical protein